MSLLALLGLARPRVPAGCTAFVSDHESGGWCIRYAREGEDQTPACPRVQPSPVFTQLPYAERELAYINGGPAWQYPPGAV